MSEDESGTCDQCGASLEGQYSDLAGLLCDQCDSWREMNASSDDFDLIELGGEA